MEGFRNIAISNCVLEGSKGIAIEAADGALAEDITISNIALRDTDDAPLFLRLNRRNRGPAEAMRPGTLRRVIISNLVSYNSSSTAASIFSGIPSNLIEDVKVNNCYFANAGLPTILGSGDHAKPFPDWRTIQVPRKRRRLSRPRPLRCHAVQRALHPPSQEHRDVSRRDCIFGTRSAPRHLARKRSSRRLL
jgi:hypothetical protein